MLKIDSCLIVRNEESNIKKLLTQLLAFSSNIYVVDTGSTDSTIEIIKSMGDERIHIDHFDWRKDFSAARNYSLSLSEDSDYIFWCDGDETLKDEFIDRLVEFTKEDDGDDAYAYGMTTKGENEDESDCIVYWRVGMFKRSLGIEFGGAVHECPCISDSQVNFERFAGLMLVNRYDKTGAEVYRNLDIYVNVHNEKKSLTTRECFYTGKEFYDLGMYAPAALFFTESIYVDPWYTEAIDALSWWLYCVKQCECIRHFKTSVRDIVDRMLGVGMLSRPVLLAYASYLYDAQDYEYAVKCAEKAMMMSDDGYSQILAQHQWNAVECLFVLVLSCYQLGSIEKADHWNSMILDIDPENGSALHNREFFKTLKRES